ncbi:hypothetical protein LguiA_029443 [Lonicera macranthoides]
MKKAIELIEQADTKGIQVQIAGRIDGKEMARVEWIREGKNGERGKGEAGLEERAVQGRRDIASKQQGSPFRTDYNKLTTLIETKGKHSALFAYNAMPIKVGECFCNLRLVTLFD